MPTKPSSADDPRILFLALTNNIGCERIIDALARNGAAVATLCPPDFFAAQTDSVTRRFALPQWGSVWLSALFVRDRLVSALDDWRPMAILPLDDISAWLLRGLALSGRVPPRLRDVLQVSLGDPGGYGASISRGGLMDVAAGLGVAVPAYARVASVAEALAFSERAELPVVVKTEHTCGGHGVVVAASRDELSGEVRRRLPGSMPARAKAFGRTLLSRAAGFLQEDEPTVMLQAFVAGRPAMRTVATDRGRVLEGVSFIAERIHPEPTGASTVIRHIENAAMDESVRLIAQALGCSGLVSFDFMVDESSGAAHLIEMNPRVIGSCHLGEQVGHDVAQSYVASLGSRPLVSTSPGRAGLTFALFPKELERDPVSPDLVSPEVRLDVPWSDEGLLQAYFARFKRTHPNDAHRFRTVTAGPGEQSA
jgi:hypothetical protein